MDNLVENSIHDPFLTYKMCFAIPQFTYTMNPPMGTPHCCLLSHPPQQNPALHVLQL